MSKIFLPNVGDLAEIQRASFFNFLTHGIVEELELFPNPCPILFPENVSDSEKIAIGEGICYLYLYLDKPIFDTEGEYANFISAAEDEQTYGIHLYVNSYYNYSGVTDDFLNDLRNGIKLAPEIKKLELKKVIKKLEITRKVCVKSLLYMGEIPLMTDDGTFIINGCERIVVNQIIRSPGIYFRKEFTPSRKVSYTATLISDRGSWTKFILDVGGILKNPAIGGENIDLFDRIYLKMTEFKEKYTGIRVKKSDTDIDKIYFPDLLKVYNITVLEFLTNIKYFEKFFPPRCLLSSIVKTVSEDLEDSKVPEDLEEFKAFLQPKRKPFEIIPEFKKKINKNLPGIKEYWKEKLTIESEEAIKEIYEERQNKQPPAWALIKEYLEDSNCPEYDENDTFYEQLKKKWNGFYPSLSEKSEDPEKFEAFLNKVFFNLNNGNFSIGQIGRYKLNKRLGLNLPKDITYLTIVDLIQIFNGLMELKYENGISDDIDHIKNKQIRSIGELLQIQFRSALLRSRNYLSDLVDLGISIKQDTDEFEELDQTPLWTPEPLFIEVAMTEFFNSSQLSQYMEQTNPLSELTQKRRISVFGPNGLKRDNISPVIRDIHPTQYGRLCPVETPEGKNSGLVTSLSMFAKYKPLGWIETPYFLVNNAKVFSNLEPIYINPEEESQTKISFADILLSKDSFISQEYVSTKENYSFALAKNTEVNLLTMTPLQIISLATTLIPFVEHNDANRALMGSNMQRQAVPLIGAQKPLVGTGLETAAVLDCGMIIKSYCQGKVLHSSCSLIKIQDLSNQTIKYNLRKFIKSNQDTCINQKPIVWSGEKVFSGQIIADGPATKGGELALGRNLTIAYMPWEGYNYEDAIIINENLIVKDLLTSIHIEKYDAFVEQGEKMTRKVPQVTKYSLRHLDKTGIAKIGSYIKPNDILMGKIALEDRPLSGEKRLFRAILNIKEPPLKDLSLRADDGTEGRIIKITMGIDNENEDSYDDFGDLNSDVEYQEDISYKEPNFVLHNGDDIIVEESENEAIRILENQIDSKFFLIDLQNEILRKIEVLKKLLPEDKILDLNVLDESFLQKIPQVRLFENFFKKNVLRREIPEEETIKTKIKESPKKTTKKSKEKKEVEEKQNQEEEKEKQEILKERQKIIQEKQKIVNNLIGLIKLEIYKTCIQNDIKIQKKLEEILTDKNKINFKTKFREVVKDPDKLLETLILGLKTPEDLKNEEERIKKILGIKFNTKKLDIATLEKLATLEKPKSTLFLEYKSYVRISEKAVLKQIRKVLRNFKDIAFEGFFELPDSGLVSIEFHIAQTRKIQVGDKLSGRHGNKGIISRVLPSQDMPYLPDGSPLDIILNPLGVPSRMNVGQVFESLLGLAGEKLAKRFKILPFDEIYGKEASRILVNQKLKEASLKTNIDWLFNPDYPGKILLRDGRTGEFFDNPITVGRAYILKLIHLVEDKIHARATGPYSSITEQPLKGKASNGGQRFGEMEVWALEAYGCSTTLQELLTVKSDDNDGRIDMYTAIVSRTILNKPTPNITESFLLLVRELNALGLDFSFHKNKRSGKENQNFVRQSRKENPALFEEERQALFKEIENSKKLPIKSRKEIEESRKKITKEKLEKLKKQLKTQLTERAAQITKKKPKKLEKQDQDKLKKGTEEKQKLKEEVTYDLININVPADSAKLKYYLPIDYVPAELIIKVKHEKLEEAEEVNIQNTIKNMGKSFTEEKELKAKEKESGVKKLQEKHEEENKKCSKKAKKQVEKRTPHERQELEEKVVPPDEEYQTSNEKLFEFHDKDENIFDNDVRKFNEELIKPILKNIIRHTNIEITKNIKDELCHEITINKDKNINENILKVINKKQSEKTLGQYNKYLTGIFEEREIDKKIMEIAFGEVSKEALIFKKIREKIREKITEELNYGANKIRAQFCINFMTPKSIVQTYEELKKEVDQEIFCEIFLEIVSQLQRIKNNEKRTNSKHVEVQIFKKLEYRLHLRALLDKTELKHNRYTLEEKDKLADKEKAILEAEKKKKEEEMEKEIEKENLKISKKISDFFKKEKN